MRVSQLNTSNAIIQQIESLNRRQLLLQRKTATGLEVEKPSDNPTAAAETVRIDAERRNAIQYRKNLQEAESTLQIGSEHLGALHDLLIRAREIIALAGGASSDEKMQAYAREMEGLAEQAFDSVNASFRGKSLFGGQAVDAPPFDESRDAGGKLTGVTYNGSANATILKIAPDFTIASRLTGGEAAHLSGVLDDLIAVRDALDNGDRNALQATDAGLSRAEDRIIVSQADLNGDLARIEWIRTRENERFLNLQESRSAAVDADLAETITQLNQASVAYRAALQTSTLVLNQSLLNFL